MREGILDRTGQSIKSIKSLDTKNNLQKGMSMKQILTIFYGCCYAVNLPGKTDRMASTRRKLYFLLMGIAVW